MDAQPFMLDFAMKAAGEGDVGGEHGLVLEGYAALFGVKDQQGETLHPGAFEHIAEEWGNPSNRKILFHHGFDPDIGSRIIGHATDYHVDDKGLYVKVFIPEQAAATWAPGAKARFDAVYQGIQKGIVRGFSVAGVFLKRGTDLFKLAMQELSVTPRPVLRQATYVVGRKAVDSYLEDTPMMPGLTIGGIGGILSPPNFGKAMSLAQKDNDQELHDHLLNKPTAVQSGHDAMDCPICTGRRTAMGMKAITKGGPDSDYLVVEDDGTQHLRVKKNGTLDHGLMGGAWAALTVGYRGNKYDGPDKAQAMTKLKALYAAEKMDTPDTKAEAGHKAVQAAEEVLAEYKAAAKAGKRHNAKDTEVIRSIMSLCQKLLGEEQAEEQSEAPSLVNV